MEKRSVTLFCNVWLHSNSGSYLLSFSALTVNPRGLSENTVTKSQSGGAEGDPDCLSEEKWWLNCDGVRYVQLSTAFQMSNSRQKNQTVLWKPTDRVNPVRGQRVSPLWCIMKIHYSNQHPGVSSWVWVTSLLSAFKALDSDVLHIAPAPSDFLVWHIYFTTGFL